ncbi:MAG: pentapeptide repeat-containing protein [Desulfomonile tiedjei]|nr:pentapeptide repeat-containing protein [Desulfomonile tiedjei]
MADLTLLAELLKGVEPWNAWREAHPEIEEPDLRLIDITADEYKDTPLYTKDAKGRPVINLERANLQGAHISGANVQGSILYQANLSDAILFDTNMQGAKLIEADLRGAYLLLANLSGANLWAANLQLANLEKANLENADVTDVRFSRGSRQRKFQGIRVSTCYGNQIFKSFAQDQDYIETMRASGRWGALGFWIWYIFADCGRSFWVWAGWALGSATLFGYLFYFWIGPENFVVDHLPKCELSTMIYYSMVTFTTLGFGDVKPISVGASALVMVEVLLGYVMLGGLISIMANKLARRS